jgi:hypothetical protein
MATWVSRDSCALGIEVEYEVKRTFVHISTRKQDLVIRFRSAPPHCSRNASLSGSEGTEVICSQVSEEPKSGSSTPSIPSEDTCSSAGDSCSAADDAMLPCSELGDCDELSLLSAKRMSHWRTSTYHCTVNSNGSVVFGFVYRRVGATWGMTVAHDRQQPALMVKEIFAGGAIDAWNKQVAGGPKEAVLPGDLLVSVNDESDCQALLDEAKTKCLVKLEFYRPKLESSCTRACEASMGQRSIVCM